MKIHDAVIGAALLVFGLGVLWYVQAFPSIPGQKYGAALFPGLIAAGVAVSGALLIVRGARTEQAWICLEGWTRRRRPIAAFASVIAGLVLYLVLAEPLGFHLTGFVLLIGWMLAFGARLALAVPVAVLAPIAIHLAFYKLLRIPLPWGVLKSVVY